jgi:hypothetical protein
MGVPVPGFQQWLLLTQEATYGVFDSGAVNKAWIRLTGDDSFTPKKAPARTVIRSADGGNRRVTTVSSRYAVSAGLKTPLYPSQAGIMMAAAAGITGTPLNLPSYTADYWDGQVIRRYLGGVCQSLDLQSDAQTQHAHLNLSWIFKSVDDANPATFAAPASTVFPSESPYLHTELSSQFSVGGTGITQFDQFHVSIKNTIAAKYYELPTIAYALWAGRDVDLMSHLTYLDNTWRGYYEAQTALTLLAEYHRSSTKKLTLNFETVSLVSDRTVTRPLASVMEQGITCQAYYDPANSNDFAATASYS